MFVDIWFRSPVYEHPCHLIGHVEEDFADRLVAALNTEFPKSKFWTE